MEKHFEALLNGDSINQNLLPVFGRSSGSNIVNER